MSIEIGKSKNLTLISGPCAIESEEMSMSIAEYISEMTKHMLYIWIRFLHQNLQYCRIFEGDTTLFEDHIKTTPLSVTVSKLLQNSHKAVLSVPLSLSALAIREPA